MNCRVDFIENQYVVAWDVNIGAVEVTVPLPGFVHKEKLRVKSGKQKCCNGTNPFRCLYCTKTFHSQWEIQSHEFLNAHDD